MAKVHAKIDAPDSFYTEVIGEVLEKSGGWLKIRATRVCDKWSKEMYDHPTSCVTWAKECNAVAV